MGRKGNNWFSSVKKALSPESKEKKTQESIKSKKKWFGKQKHSTSDSTTLQVISAPPPPPPPSPPIFPPHTQVEEVKLHDEQINIAGFTTTSAPPASPQVDQITVVSRFAGKSKEEVAAIKIQTAFRGYLARRALRALRGLVRLKSLIEGAAVKRQVTSTLRCMQTLSRVQSQACLRRIRMSEENQALQRQLLQNHAKELENLRMGEEWDDSLQSKEKLEANLLSKYEAAMRRERAMAYSFSHQQAWKNSSKTTNLMFMDPRNPAWGWSWLERFMAARPLESRSVAESGGEICKSYARYQLNSEMPSPTASQPKLQSPLTPSRPVSRKLKPASLRAMANANAADDDSKSMTSVQSDRFRRHSIAGSSVCDDESMGSSPAVPSYMVATKSAKAKSRLQSPLGTASPGKENELVLGSAKKHLSYPGSPAKPRRLSAPPKIENISTAI